MKSEIKNKVTCIFMLLAPKVKDMGSGISILILLHVKFLQFDWLRAVVFQLNLKYLHVKVAVSMALQKISHVAV